MVQNQRRTSGAIIICQKTTNLENFEKSVKILYFLNTFRSLFMRILTRMLNQFNKMREREGINTKPLVCL